MHTVWVNLFCLKKLKVTHFNVTYLLYTIKYSMNYTCRMSCYYNNYNLLMWRFYIIHALDGLCCYLHTATQFSTWHSCIPNVRQTVPTFSACWMWTSYGWLVQVRNSFLFFLKIISPFPHKTHSVSPKIS